jgi:hypothetical protein
VLKLGRSSGGAAVGTGERLRVGGLRSGTRVGGLPPLRGRYGLATYLCDVNCGAPADVGIVTARVPRETRRARTDHSTVPSVTSTAILTR